MPSLRRLARQLQQLQRSLVQLLRQPRKLGSNSRKLYQAWRLGGVPMLKHQLLALSQPEAQLHDFTRSWQDMQHVLQQTILPQLRQDIAQLQHAPTIAILVPTYNTNADMLHAMLASVQQQVYPHWQLCIADDASPQPHVRALLQSYAAQDSRIRLHLGTSNHGVSHATNCALALTDAPFCVFLDHDDLLQPQALWRVAQSVLEDDPDMLYADEVLVDAQAQRVLQYVLRPAFSPQFLRNHPYIVHLIGFRTDLLRGLGGLDEKLGISQDYDLILRATEQARTIVHIPEVLYQWRIHPSSAGHEKMGQVVSASTQLLQRHLQRQGHAATAAPSAAFNFFTTQWQVASHSRVAIIIPTKNLGDLVRQCIDSIRATVQHVNYQIILIDHASTDADSLAYFDSLQTSADVTVLRYAGVFNFSSINNWAVQQLSGPYTHYLFCNNDIQALEPGWLEHLVGQCQEPGVGITGAQLLYPDRSTIQHAGVCVGAFRAAEHYGKFLRLPDNRIDVSAMGRLICAHEVSAVTAACLLMRKEAFDAIGGFDEALAVGFGDVDLCLRTLQQGWRIVYCPQATLVHHESMSRGVFTGEDAHPQDTALFLQRWHTWLQQGDPYFHPAFDLQHTCWQVRQPMSVHAQVQRRIFQRQPGSAQQLLRYSPAQTPSGTPPPAAAPSAQD